MKTCKELIEHAQWKLEQIGAKVEWEDFGPELGYVCNIAAQENIVVEKLFDVFELFSFCLIQYEYNQACDFDFQCVIHANEIINTNDNRLLRIQISVNKNKNKWIRGGIEKICIDLLFENEKITFNHISEARDFVFSYLENRKKAILKPLKKDAEEKELQLLQEKFESIGAKWEYSDGTYYYSGEKHYIESFYNCYIEANEDIVLEKLFDLLEWRHPYKIKDYDCFYETEFYCDIKAYDGHHLLDLEFYQESIEIEFPSDNERITFENEDYIKEAKDWLFCYLENRKIKRLGNIIEDGIKLIENLSITGNSLEEKVCSALESSNYIVDFQKGIDCLKDKDMLIVNYELPNMSNLSNTKEYIYVAPKKEIKIKRYTDRDFSKLYEDTLYSITLRSLYEIFSIDTSNEIQGITFNGYVTQINPAFGITERKCILSIQVDKNKYSQINLSLVDPKACFKALKGVSAAKLIDVSPVTPILIFNKDDRRFVDGKEVSVNQGTNLAAMHWEDFEHLVRELFEIEFAKYGGEVHVTQASRDGGVDAIIFDPDPLRGGKIVVQAKRYTNTVGVSAVRDLYGTVINEGANTGILITTSDYGHDSYEFAKGKPLKLLNGGHLLALLRKNGRNAHINLEEAKKNNEMQYGKK